MWAEPSIEAPSTCTAVGVAGCGCWLDPLFFLDPASWCAGPCSQCLFATRTVYMATAVCVYAAFAPEWERSTGVPLATVLTLAKRFRDGVAQHLAEKGVTVSPMLVDNASSIPDGAVVINACALGNESSTTWVGTAACASPPMLWDWVSPKHTYMSALVAAGICIPPSWLVAPPCSIGAGVRTAEISLASALLAEATADADVSTLLLGTLTERGHERVVLKECNALGGTLAVHRLEALQAVTRAVQLASGGHHALIQPDLSAFFAVGETKCCVALSSAPGSATGSTSRVLGARHAPPGSEFGRFFPPECLPGALIDVATAAGDVLRAHALSAGAHAPPIVRVDLIALPGDREDSVGGRGGGGDAAVGVDASFQGEMRWCVNEFELADFASWMWQAACGHCSSGGMSATMDDAVCKAHAEFIACALGTT